MGGNEVPTAENPADETRGTDVSITLGRERDTDGIRAFEEVKHIAIGELAK
jgi:hypothetical protein